VAALRLAEEAVRQMSVLQRAMEKAEREGRLRSWTVEPQDVRRDLPRESFAEDARLGADAAAFELDTWNAANAAAPVSLSPMLVAATAPDSVAAEQFRLLRSRVESRAATTRTQLIVVTSPRLGEGKTTISANLALCLAQDPQQRVLLIEADLRRPRLSALFGIRAEPGVADVLTGSATIGEAMVPIAGYRLFVLPAGTAARRSPEALASSVLRGLVDGLRPRFTRILIDTPPLAMADTQELARIADGVLLVVRAGMTPRPALETAFHTLERDKIIGFVLNGIEEVSEYYDNSIIERYNGER
jgi:capsular exopolysaccharide synthesis family protein